MSTETFDVMSSFEQIFLIISCFVAISLSICFVSILVRNGYFEVI